MRLIKHSQITAQAVITIMVMTVLSSFGVTDGYAATRTIFIVQPGRDRPTLQQDAELIYQCIQAIKNGDSVHAFTTNRQSIVTLNLAKRLNRLQLKRAKQPAINQLKAYFLKHFDNPLAENAVVDIAGTIAQAMDRFNSNTYDQMVLVLLTDGLQHTRNFSWREGIPSDSWIANPDSPFSLVRANESKAELRVLILPTQASYVDSYHARGVKRWYTLFFQHKNAQLMGFTYDHHASAELLVSGLKVEAFQRVESTDIEGPLGFTKVQPLTTN